jgi:ring-1,2-phenylacetyl-CoA epoxidase subunit PaaD
MPERAGEDAVSAEPVLAAALTDVDLARIRGILAQVPDPEIPVLSVLDLGVIRHVRQRPDGRIEIGVTPTWTGCPATPAIKDDVGRALARAGFDAVTVDVLAPPWTTDEISPEGRRKLAAFGIAPPGSADCPRCGSSRVTRLSEFGSTPCKALFRCDSCLEPFDSFKCL